MKVKMNAVFYVTLPIYAEIELEPGDWEKAKADSHEWLKDEKNLMTAIEQVGEDAYGLDAERFEFAEAYPKGKMKHE